MEEKLVRLKEILNTVSDLNHIEQLLGWDQQTYMPPGGAGERGDQLATLARFKHSIFTSNEMGQLLNDLWLQISSLDPESDEACLIRKTRHNYKKASRLTPEWVEAEARITTLSFSAWEKAKITNDFISFKPYLERIIELKRQYAAFFVPYEHIYDPLLDDFEPGLKTAEVQSIFSAIRPQQVILIKEIASRKQVDSSFLHLDYPEQQQWNFGVEVITRLGYDWQRGRQDKSMHPFTSSFGLDDVRITTRVSSSYLPMGLFGTIHECGHALYEQGINPSYRRTPLADGASMAIHESQSRMWENLVGRSRAFWVFFYPRLQQVFSTQLGNVDLDTFYRGINNVQPSLIRVESDEATYNLHIMLRLELEIGLLEGSLAVADLPEAWNLKVKEYLGLLPPDNTQGVLQDVHWSGGLIGYFPTYALGNLVSVQLWECIEKDIPNLEAQIRQGQFGELLGWLREKVHQFGAKFEPQVLIQKVTGSPIDPQPYLRYLNRKYGDIYGL